MEEIILINLYKPIYLNSHQILFAHELVNNQTFFKENKKNLLRFELYRLFIRT